MINKVPNKVFMINIEYTKRDNAYASYSYWHNNYWYESLIKKYHERYPDDNIEFINRPIDLESQYDAICEEGLGCKFCVIYNSELEKSEEWGEYSREFKTKVLSNNIIDTAQWLTLREFYCRDSNPNMSSIEDKIIKSIHYQVGNKNVNDYGKIWITSDTHFNHTNIIKYTNRPFENTKIMDETIINNWNSVVDENDIVWHLGDFAFGDTTVDANGKRRNRFDVIREYLPQLNGKINLVLGNHDRRMGKSPSEDIKLYMDLGFNKVYDMPVIFNDFFILSHEPKWISNGDAYVNIFGHVHNQEMYKTISSNSICVCVERWNYTPISWDTIIEKFNNA